MDIPSLEDFIDGLLPELQPYQKRILVDLAKRGEDATRVVVCARTSAKSEMLRILNSWEGAFMDNLTRVMRGSAFFSAFTRHPDIATTRRQWQHRCVRPRFIGFRVVSMSAAVQPESNGRDRNEGESG